MEDAGAAPTVRAPDVTMGAPSAYEARGAHGALEPSDAWLIARVCTEPPDVDALDALVRRHWRALIARCELLSLDREVAHDLAQETWVRMLRARRTLRPDGNLPAYLATIATNLWRNKLRDERRAGPLGERRLRSIDGATAAGDAAEVADTIPDPRTRTWDAQLLLKLDVDRALLRLGARAREVLIARYVDGESAAEIGRRFGRTEQTVTGWLRQAVAEMRQHLDELGGA
jgi:RNA polymerase sigma-70 factor (ECF subfamily)